MNRIRVLGDSLANKIAAGEVVERPASVVKELVENSIDAGASELRIVIEGGGKELIQVEDDGQGIAADDVLLAFERHATSKLDSPEGLFAISTLGFRGEALPSIASVSRLKLTTKTKTENAGSFVEIHGGQLIAHQPVGASDGTVIAVRQLFFNTPARYKFLKQDASERRYILDTVIQIAMANPNVKFTVVADGKELFKSPGDGSVLSVILAAHGRSTAAAMVPVDRMKNFVRVFGYVSKPSLHKGTRKDETLLVNGRVISSRMLSSALEKGYQSLLPSRRFPVAVLGLELDPSLLDVNVHPAKAEVRFQDEREIYKAVLFAVKEALLSQDLSVSMSGGQSNTSSSEPGGWEHTRAGANYLGSVKNSASSLRPVPSNEQMGPNPFWLGSGVTKTPAQSYSVDKAGNDQGIGDYLRERDAQLWERGGGQQQTEHSSQEDSGSESIVLPQPKSRTGKAFSNSVESIQQVPMFAGLVPMGQWLNTYIVMAQEQALWLIDQHIAHERVLYERLKASYRQDMGSQPLLLPVQLELAPKEAAILGDNLDLLTELSFGVEEFGGNTYLVRSVPLAFSNRLDQAGIAGMIQELIEHWEKGGDKLDATITTMACRAAVKAGDALSWPEIEAILLDLSETENPYTCPHGRPIIVKLTLAEVERRFGRR